MGTAPSWELPLHGNCPFMGSGSLWNVPNYRWCPFIASALLWEMPLYGNPLAMHLYEGCLNGTCPFVKVPFYDKGSLWELSCIFTRGSCTCTTLWKMTLYPLSGVLPISKTIQLNIHSLVEVWSCCTNSSRHQKQGDDLQTLYLCTSLWFHSQHLFSLL